MKTFAERLRYVRNLRGLTQARLARACNLSQGAIANYEAQIRYSAKEIFKIAAVLKVSAQWLAEGVGPMEYEAPALGGENRYQLADGQASSPLAAWPFRDISPDVYWTLSERDHELIENTVATMIVSLRREHLKE